MVRKVVLAAVVLGIIVAFYLVSGPVITILLGDQVVGPGQTGTSLQSEEEAGQAIINVSAEIQDLSTTIKDLGEKL